MARVGTPLPSIASPSRPPSRQQSEGAESSHSASVDAAKAKKIPRPKNPWIIYRAHQMKLMQEEGRHKLPQAAVSKIIAERWKHESPEVRAHYEYLADCDKAEHKQKYPDYLFRPEKRENKLRRKQEEREAKSRQKQEARRAKTRDRSVSVSNPLTSTNHIPYYPPYPHVDAPYRPMPSPPLAYATTPEPEPIGEDDTPTNEPGPVSASQKLLPEASDKRSSKFQGALEWEAVRELIENVLDPSSIPAPTIGWSPEDDASTRMEDGSDELMVDFGMPAITTSGWDDDSSDMITVMLSETSAPSVYALSGLEEDDMDEPPSSIHVSMGTYPPLPPEPEAAIPELAEFTDVLKGFDFIPYATLEVDTEADCDEAENRSRNIDDAMMQYLNEDMLSLPEPRSHGPGSSDSTSTTPTTSPQKSSYKPPSGSSRTGMRRVGGSWRPPADLQYPESPILRPAQGSWHVAAS